MAQNSISQGTLKADFEVNKTPMFASKVSNEGLWWTGLRYSLKKY